MKRTIILCLIFMAGFVPKLAAHILWVNSFESHAHQPGHAIVSAGWGHILPIDDITNNVNARALIESFSLIEPDGNKTALRIPEQKPAKPVVSTGNVNIFDADIASHKIALKKDSGKGNYLVEIRSKKNVFTSYLDQKGRKRMALKPMNRIKGIKEVIYSIQYQASGKTYLTVGEWTNPKPVGQALEIVPQTDLSTVKVGDIVRFNVLFEGKPLSKSPRSIEYMTARSTSFGQGDDYWLFSYISKGKAQFKVQSAGQWLVNVFHNEPVTKHGPLKDLLGQVTDAVYGASLTFTVK